MSEDARKMKNAKAAQPSEPRNVREVILDIATDLFARRGYEGVVMREIAKQSRITLPTVYHYFGNKEQLYREVEVKVYSSNAESLMKSLAQHADPRDRLRNFLSELISLLADNPQFFKLMQRNLIDGWEENNRFLVDLSLQKVVDELRSVLQACKPEADGGMEPIFIVSAVLGYVTMRPVIRELNGYSFADQPAATQQEMLIDAISRAVLPNGEH